MGEIADMIVDGVMCEACGEVLPDILRGVAPPGHPRRCDRCGPAWHEPMVMEARGRRGVVRCPACLIERPALSEAQGPLVCDGRQQRPAFR